MTEQKSRRYVLDTSLFMAVDIRQPDQSMMDAVKELMDQIEEASGNGVEFYMPSTTYEEFREIMENKASEELMEQIDTWINRKGASRHEEQLPANTVYQFVEEMRKRIDRGLRISEEAVREVEDTEEPDKEHYTKEDVVVSDLRDKYREAMRKGVPDSGEDLDLLILARQLDATLVSEDNGVLGWAEEFGVKHIRGNRFPAVLENL